MSGKRDDELVVPFERLRSDDVARVGGKTAALGELVHALAPRGIHVPDGFAVTAAAYWQFVDANGLRAPIAADLRRLRGGRSVARVGGAIRKRMLAAKLPDDVARAIVAAYRDLSTDTAGARAQKRNKPAVAVRSSATAEDLPGASFAGQHDSFLNIEGERELLAACVRCFASLFTDRAITYRETKGFDHMKVALSIAVQAMVRADRGAAGVAFTIDTESGFPNVVVVDAAFGLGESVVQGTVTPDEYVVLKPLLGKDDLVPIVGRTIAEKARKVVYAHGERSKSKTKAIPTTKNERHGAVLEEEDVLALAEMACAIEHHYDRPMDIEWAKDGVSGELSIVQARPETVHAGKTTAALRSYRLQKRGRALARGIAVGQAIATGPVQRIASAGSIGQFRDGGILVTTMTDPDWVPIMKRAAAIVTEEGGRTCHAAIVARELGIPAIVGAEGAMRALRDGTDATVSCAEGAEGVVYAGRLPYACEDLETEHLASTRTRVMINLATPDAAFRWSRLPVGGIGLARTEFIVGDAIGVHPMALLHPDRVAAAARREIAARTRGHASRSDYFVDRLALGIAKLGASQYPKRVLVRTSDFKTNEYRGLLGGEAFEPQEHNPMIGFRGASRYVHEGYREAFALECEAFRRVRERIGLTNVHPMIPFVRTLREADDVLALMAAHDLVRGRNGLEIHLMCEVPSTVILARDFAERFDGFSIGSNDLTQLVLGVDRDSALLAKTFDENDEAVRWCIEATISRVHASGGTVGFCGQAPSDDPAFAAFLVEAGVDSISVDPDSVVATIRVVADVEARLRDRSAEDARAARH